MRAELVFSRDDFAQAFAEFVPSTIWLNADRSHWLRIGRVLRLDVDGERGVRVVCAAEVKWTLHADADEVHFSVRPVIEPAKGGGQRLAFHIDVEDVSFAGVLGLFDDSIIRKVDKALAAHVLAWNYSRTLTRTFALPARLFKDVSGVTLKTVAGSSRIEPGAVVLSLDLQIGFARRTP